MLDKTAWMKLGVFYMFLIVCSLAASAAVGFATTPWAIIMLLIVAVVGIPLAKSEIKRHRKELQDQELVSVGEMKVE